MRGRGVFGVRLLVLAFFLAALTAVSASAQVTTHTNFKCPKGQKPFCLKNSSNGEIIITGFTAYRGANQTGDSASRADDNNGGDDQTLAKGASACWCFPWKVESYDATIYSSTAATAFLGGWNVLQVDQLASVSPVFEGGVVRISVAKGATLPDADDLKDVWVVNGESSDLPGVTFTDLEGEPFTGLLHYSGTVEAESSDTSIEYEVVPDAVSIFAINGK